MKLRVITSSPDVLGGTPVFEGTRVPLQTLIDYLQAGDSIDAFLEDFPSIKREQVVEVLNEMKDQYLSTVA